jgi:hypothetical protein
LRLFTSAATASWRVFDQQVYVVSLAVPLYPRSLEFGADAAEDVFEELPREPFDSAGYAAGFSSIGISWVA